MFATWKYDRETSEVQNLRQAYDPISARSSQHQACDRCHEKKLKCSGEKDGCDRCLSSSTKCDYTRCETRCSRRRKRSVKSTVSSTNDRNARDGSVSSPGSQYGSSTSTISTISSTTTASSQYSSRSRKGSQPSSRRQSVGSPTKFHKSIDTLPPLADFASALPPSTPLPTTYDLNAYGTPDERAAYPRTTGLMSSPLPVDASSLSYQTQPGSQQQQQYSPPQGYYGANDWSRGYSEVTAASMMEPTYITTMPPQQVYPAISSPNEYPNYNEYSCFQNPTHEVWQYCR